MAISVEQTDRYLDEDKEEKESKGQKMATEVDAE